MLSPSKTALLVTALSASLALVTVAPADVYAASSPTSTLIAKYFTRLHQDFYAKNFDITDKQSGFVGVITWPSNGGNYVQGAYLFRLVGRSVKLVYQFSLAGSLQVIPSDTIVPGMPGLVVIDNGSASHSIGTYNGPYSSALYGGESVDMVGVFNTHTDRLVWKSPVFAGTADLIPLYGGRKSGLALRVVGVPTSDTPNGFDNMNGYLRSARIFQWLPAKRTMDVASLGVSSYFDSSSKQTETSLGFSGRGALVGALGYLEGPSASDGYVGGNRGSIYGYKFSMPYIPQNSVITSINGNVPFNAASYRLFTEDVPFGSYASLDVWSYGVVKRYRLESVPEPLSWALPLLQRIRRGPYGSGY